MVQVPPQTTPRDSVTPTPSTRPPASPPPATDPPPESTELNPTDSTTLSNVATQESDDSPEANQVTFPTTGDEDFTALRVTDQHFRGSALLGTGDPNNPVFGNNPGTGILPDGYATMDYQTLNGNIQSPDDVAALMDAVDEQYDKPRGEPLGGDGPLGAQSPDETWRRFQSATDPYSGVCRDIHQLGAAMLPPEYQARQIGYVAGRTSHSLLAYRDPNGGGYGIVEYGTHYSPQDIAARLGRPATSYEEALMVVRPESKVIFRWTEPQEGEVGHVESAYYTQGYQNYFESLNLNFGEADVPEVAFSFDSNQGLVVNYSPDTHWRLEAGFNPTSPGDPTGRNSMYVSGGYRWGDSTDWFGISLGVNHRPNEGAGIIGSNQFWDNPTTIIGLGLAGNTQFWEHSYSDSIRGAFNLRGNAGIGLPFNHERESDAGEIVDGDYGFDNDLMSGLVQFNGELAYNVHADLAPGLAFESGLFVSPDLYLTGAAVGMGAQRPFGNIGIRNALTYTTGPWQLGLRQQALFHQDNNLQEDGVRADVTYRSDRLTWTTGLQWQDSVEGSRVSADTRLGVQVAEQVSLDAGLRHEQIFADDLPESYTVPGATRVDAGMRVSF